MTRTHLPQTPRQIDSRQLGATGVSPVPGAARDRSYMTHGTYVQHGHWIRAGNTFDDLAAELDRAGDEAWIYHNIRGSFFPAEWTRLVNGYYLWISPLRAHVPWTYYSFKGNPFDCTDGPRLRGGDFAYAVPDPEDASRMIPTRHWEGFREGIDDMRYLATVRSLAAQHQGTPIAEEAARWLSQLRRELTPTRSDLEPIETESPVLVWLSRKLDGSDYRRIRGQAADYIRRLSAGAAFPSTGSKFF